MSKATANLAEANGGRFSAILGQNDCARAPHDQILLETDEFVVTPTLGSILPYWLLVIPIGTFANFAVWRAATDVAPSFIKAQALDGLGINRSRAIWFEHGASESGSVLGCGVDHAHLHLIVDPPFTHQNFFGCSRQQSDVDWKKCEIEQAYQSVRTDHPYLIMGSVDYAFVTQNTNGIGSQFFRHVIADLVGRPDEWDYRKHAHSCNVQMTLRKFGRYAA